MGVYSTSQFFGAFLGGVFGGWVQGAYGLGVAHVVIGMLCLAWLGVVFGMQEPAKLASYRASLPFDASLATEALTDRIGHLQGVEEVSLHRAEQSIYLKINKKEFDEEQFRHVLEEFR